MSRAVVLLLFWMSLVLCSRRLEAEQSPVWPPAESPAARRTNDLDNGPADRIRCCTGDRRCTLIKASSDRHFSEKEARRGANSLLTEKLVESVAARTGCIVPEKELRRPLTRLMYAADIERDGFTETIQKPYGTMYRHHLRVSLPEETLRRWTADVAHQYKARLQLRAGAAALTVLGWLCGLLVVVKLDRWTLGYRRPAIVTGTLLVLVCGTSAGWMMVLN